MRRVSNEDRQINAAAAGYHVRGSDDSTIGQDLLAHVLHVLWSVGRSIVAIVRQRRVRRSHGIFSEPICMEGRSASEAM